MSRVPIFIVEAFTVRDNESYTGNPAAVCLLEYDDDIPDEQKQKIAQTMNLSETAFVARNWKRPERFLQEENTPTTLKRTLRWFTPVNEVPLCGHATVASTKTILAVEGEGSVVNKIEFHSRFRGLLVASIDKSNGFVVLDFPANLTEQIPLESRWLPSFTKAVLGSDFDVDDPLSTLEDVQLCTRESILLLRLKKRPDEEPVETIKRVKPKFQQLVEESTGDVQHTYQIVTIEGDKTNTEADLTRPNFYSRFFASKAGIDEDPVTGMAHTILTPYWTKELQLDGKTLIAHQASTRGGDLSCRWEGERVRISGQARVLLKGELNL